MGHGPGNKTFLNSYKAQTSTVDLQASMHDAHVPRDVLKMSSISLGRTRDAPLSLSAEGEDRVMADPRIREANRRCTEILDKLTEKYPSIEAAKRDGGIEFAPWHDAKKELALRTRQVREAELQKDYNTHYQAHETLKLPVSSEANGVETPVLDTCSYAPESDIQIICTGNAPDHIISVAELGQATSLETVVDIGFIDPDILSPDEFAMSAGQKEDDRFRRRSRKS